MAEKLYLQIYTRLRDDVLSGKLAAGTRLPSKRRYAQARGVSVVTVESAYGLLCDEGYVVSVPKSGYYVADLPGPPRAPAAPPRYAPEIPESPALDLSRGRIPEKAFPFTAWARIMRRQLLDRSTGLLSDAGAQGARELREAICDYLYRAKGLSCDPDCTVVGAGTDHLYNLIIQLFGHDTVFGAEDPGYLQFFRVCGVSGAKCLPLQIDGKGVSSEALRRTAASVIHLTPSHHFPTGRVMDVSRRLEVLDWAERRPDRYVIEDDYDSEFSFRLKPVEPLQALDGSGRVIYMNTFSKTIAPSMRISYMILPKPLMDLFRERLGFYSCSVPAPEQYTLAQFISEGHFERHIYSMGRFYKKKRDRVIGILKSSPFSDKIEILEEKAGLHFLVKIDTGITEERIRELLADCSVKIRFLSDYTLSPPAPGAPTAIVNYSGLSEEDLTEALRRLSLSLEKS